MERMSISIQEKRGRVRRRKTEPGAGRGGSLLRRGAGKAACFLGVGVIGVLAIPVAILVLLISGLWTLTSRAASWGSRDQSPGRDQRGPELEEKQEDEKSAGRNGEKGAYYN